jgi:hypothetical protein
MSHGVEKVMVCVNGVWAARGIAVETEQTQLLKQAKNGQTPTRHLYAVLARSPIGRA